MHVTQSSLVDHERGDNAPAAVRNFGGAHAPTQEVAAVFVVVVVVDLRKHFDSVPHRPAPAG